MSYTLVPTELIVDGAITSAKLDTNIAISGTLGVTGEVTLATHLVMGDNDKIKIGTGGDLEIYHDGSNSYISNSTGNIYLGDTNGAVHIQAKLNEESIICSADGAVTLYHDNAVKLATASGGVTVTGELDATSLDISGNADIDGTLETDNLTVGGQQGTDGQVLTSTGSRVAWEDASGGVAGIVSNADATAITISSSEKVGIGIDPTEGILHIKSDDAGEVELLTLENSTGTNGKTTLTFKTTSTDSTKSAQIFAERINASGHTDLAFRTYNGSTTEAVRIDHDGQVGIGTTSPSSFSNFANNLVVNEAGNGGITIATGTGNHASLHFADGTSGDAAYRGFFDYNHAADSLGIGTAGAERLRIDSAGKVHIGATSGTGILNVDGGSGEGSLYVEGTASGSAITARLLASDGGAVFFGSSSNHDVRIQTNSVNKLTIKANGLCGIGTDNPSQLLHLKSTGDAALRIEADSDNVNEDDNAYIEFSQDGSLVNAYVGYDTNTNVFTINQKFADSVTIKTNDTERWRIDSSGRMTNAFDAPYGSILQVAGNSISGGVVNFIDPDVSVATSNHILRCTFSVDTDSSGKFIAFYDGGGNIGSVSQNGASSVLFNTTSDERLKENIVDASSQLDVIKNVKVREFDWKSSSKHDIGMIAQELKDVIPNVVIEGGDDVTEEPFGVDYGKLTPYLIKAIQEQQTVIEDLKSRIETLEG